MLQQVKLGIFLFVPQILFIFLYGFLVDYDTTTAGATPNSPDSRHFSALYPMFQDVHVMILVGFGFLMTFLKRYSYGSVAFNFMLSAFVIQWAVLMRGFLDSAEIANGKINVNLESLLNADFAAGSVLISFGAVLGVLSPIQLIVMAFLEVIFYAVNEFVIVGVFQISDIGGSMVIHAFGAYFGLAVSFLHWRPVLKDHNKEGSVYHSDLFAMIGTLFLWLFWPSFNAAPAAGTFAGQRAIITTVYSLSAATVASFALSSVMEKSGKFSMVHIQNATLAGGVAVGSVANLRLGLMGSVAVGGAAGALSVFGYRFITPALQRRLNLHDTCGVHNLHGMPGVLSAIVAAILARFTSPNTYTGDEIAAIYPGVSERGMPYNFSRQANMQLAGLATTLGIAIIGGLVTGLVLNIRFLDFLSKEALFDDCQYWILPEDEKKAEAPTGSMLAVIETERDSANGEASTSQDNGSSRKHSAAAEIPT